MTTTRKRRRFTVRAFLRGYEATRTWLYGGIDAGWDEVSNWNGGASIPTTADDVLITGSTMPNAAPSVAVSLHTFDSSGAATGTTISGTVSANITVTNGVTLGVAGNNASAHTFTGTTSGGAIVLQGGAIFYPTNGTTYTSLAISDSARMDSSNVAMTISGSCTVTGTGEIGSATGASTITLGSGMTVSGTASLYSFGLTFDGTGTVAISGSPFISRSAFGTTTMTFGGSLAITLAGTPTIDASLVLNTSGALTTSISVTGITVTQVGNLTLNNSAAWQAATTAAGAIVLNNTADLHASVSACTSITANDTSTISSGTIASSGALTLNNSSVVSGGTLTVNSFAFHGSSRLTGGTVNISANSTMNGTSQATGGTFGVSGAVNITLSSNARLGGVAIVGDGTWSGTITTVTISEDQASQADVRHGTVYANSTKTGTAYIPSANDVRSGTNVDATTGNMTEPAQTDVKTGVQYGTSGTQYTGSLAAGGAARSRIFAGF